MKKTKRLAALFLALMMSLSLLAVTASAYGVEEHAHDEECCDAVIMRLPAAPYCPKCGEPMVHNGVGEDRYGNRVYYFECFTCHTSATVS